MPAMLRAQLAVMLQYRGEIILWAVWGIVYPAVLIAMWTAAAKGRSVGGYFAGDIAAYYIATMVVGHLNTAWDVFEMGFFVRSGMMSARLLKPIMPIWESVVSNIAYKIITLVLVAPAWLAIGWYVQPTFHTQWWNIAVGVPAVLMAAAIAYVWGYCCAMLAFVMTKADAAGELYFGLSLFFGGRFAMLDVLPLPLQLATWLMPFRWSLAFPVELLIGRLSAADALRGLAMQGFWLFAGVVFLRWAWRAGLKRYSAVGA